MFTKERTLNKKFWSERINFGKLSVPRFMSAPIDGVLDSPARQLIRKLSKKELLFGQMRHVASISNRKIMDELNINSIEHPYAFQISVNTTEYIDAAIDRILEINSNDNNNLIQMINLNSGCPAKKVVHSGAGVSLMGDIFLLKSIIKKIIKRINGKIPFTVKIRAGYYEKNALEVATMCEEQGADGIIIHPRLKEEGFTGELDFELVRLIKNRLKIPIVFSGNIINGESARKTYERTGADGFMIGRALYGAPWKIQQIYEEVRNNKFYISEKEKVQYALEHLRLNSEHYGKGIGFKLLKQHLPLYIKNIDGASKLRLKLVLAKNEEEMKIILTDLIEKI